MKRSEQSSSQPQSTLGSSTFILKCPKCKVTFSATVDCVRGESTECDMCGSHSSFTISCPDCGFMQSESEI
jgi:primosomal protein N'